MDILKAQIIHYLSVMPESDIINGGITASCIANGFDGIDDRRQAFLVLCGMEFDGILERVPGPPNQTSGVHAYRLTKQVNQNYS